MGHGLGVRMDRDAARLDGDVFYAEADVDDLALDALRHGHPAQRRLVREMIPYHRVQEFFGGHVVRRLSCVLGVSRAVIACGAGRGAAGATDLLYPVLPVRRNAVAPLYARYSSVAHHEQREHVGHDLACVQNQRALAEGGKGKGAGARKESALGGS